MTPGVSAASPHGHQQAAPSDRRDRRAAGDRPLTQQDEDLIPAAATATRSDLRHNREFRIVLVGQSVSALGDAISLTVLPLLVVALTGSGIAMGIVGVLQLLPDLFLGLPAGALADRWDRRRMIIAADLGRALLTAAIPLSVVLGWPTMTVVLMVTFPIHALRVLFLAAWTATIPSIVDREDVGMATGYIEAVFSGCLVLGPAVAGLLVTVVGPGATLALDAASFLFSAGTMVLIRRPLRADAPPAARPIVADIREGVRYLVRQPVLRMAVLFWSTLSVTTAALIPVIIFFLTVGRSQPPGVVGLVLAAYGLGSLVGALLATRLSDGRLGWLMLAAAACLGLSLLGAAAASAPIAQAPLALAAGAATSLVFVPYLTLRSTIPPHRLLGRIGGSARTLSVGLAPIGTLAAGVALDRVGGETTLILMAAMVMIASMAFSLSPALRGARARGGRRPAQRREPAAAT